MIISDKIKFSDSPDEIELALRAVEDFLYHSADELCRQIKLCNDMNVRLSQAD